MFVVWLDTIDDAISASNDVLFSNSTDSGVTFADPVNLSASSGNALSPKISGNATDVNVVWRDNTFADIPASSIDGQVWFKSYNIASASSGLQVISEATTDKTKTPNNLVTPVPVPNISFTDDIIIAAWSPAKNDPILTSPPAITRYTGSFKTAIPSTVDISFNSTEYLSPRNATVTVVDASASTSVPVDVFFPQSGKQTLTLLEGPSGVFSKSLQLYNTTVVDLLQGDVFSANYTASGSTITTQAKIQETRILDFIPTGAVLHDIGATVGLRLTDADSNLLSGTTESVNAKRLDRI